MGLFEPVWMSEKESKALKAVSRISSQKRLAKIVNHAPADSVRRAALDKLTDEELLLDIAIHGARGKGYQDICSDAQDKLTDQNLLAAVAKAAGPCPSYVRMGAIRKLTDQAIVSDIARTEWDRSVRLAAADCLADKNLAQEVYIHTALHTPDYEFARNEAAEKVKDKTVLETTACAEGRHFGEEIGRYTIQNGDTHYPMRIYRCIVCGKEYEEKGESWH